MLPHVFGAGVGDDDVTGISPTLSICHMLVHMEITIFLVPIASLGTTYALGVILQ